MINDLHALLCFPLLTILCVSQPNECTFFPSFQREVSGWRKKWQLRRCPPPHFQNSGVPAADQWVVTQLMARYMPEVHHHLMELKFFNDHPDYAVPWLMGAFTTIANIPLEVSAQKHPNSKTPKQLPNAPNPKWKSLLIRMLVLPPEF